MRYLTCVTHAKVRKTYLHYTSPCEDCIASSKVSLRTLTLRHECAESQLVCPGPRSPDPRPLVAQMKGPLKQEKLPSCRHARSGGSNQRPPGQSLREAGRADSLELEAAADRPKAATRLKDPKCSTSSSQGTRATKGPSWQHLEPPQGRWLDKLRRAWRPGDSRQLDRRGRCPGTSGECGPGLPGGS